MRTTATMMFGHVETLEERVDHLHPPARAAGPHRAASPPSSPGPSSPRTPPSAGRRLTSFQYLRTLAVARVMLDNFPNVQASWVTQGGKIGQVSLRFGANDFGSLMIEENVVSAAGAHFRLTEAEIARAIQDAGFVPKRRTMHYEIVGDPYCWSHEAPPDRLARGRGGPLARSLPPPDTPPRSRRCRTRGAASRDQGLPESRSLLST